MGEIIFEFVIRPIINYLPQLFWKAIFRKINSKGKQKYTQVHYSPKTVVREKSEIKEKPTEKNQNVFVVSDEGVDLYYSFNLNGKIIKHYTGGTEITILVQNSNDSGIKIGKTSDGYWLDMSKLISQNPPDNSISSITDIPKNTEEVENTEAVEESVEEKTNYIVDSDEGVDVYYSFNLNGKIVEHYERGAGINIIFQHLDDNGVTVGKTSNELWLDMSKLSPQEQNSISDGSITVNEEKVDEAEKHIENKSNIFTVSDESVALYYSSTLTGNIINHLKKGTQVTIKCQQINDQGIKVGRTDKGFWLDMSKLTQKQYGNVHGFIRGVRAPAAESVYEK